MSGKPDAAWALILTGFMATGKSAVARALARRLGWRHFDCDTAIAARAGVSIAEIFRTAGESRFRALECAVIDALAEGPSHCPRCGRARFTVIATGGGAIVDPHNYAQLKRVGAIVCLTARPEVIARRVGASAKARPMLSQGGKPLRERIVELLAARAEAYAGADFTVDTSDLNLDQVVEAIIVEANPPRSEPCRCSA